MTNLHRALPSVAVVSLLLAVPGSGLVHGQLPEVDQFSDWSVPVNLGPVINSPFDENHPAISKNDLSLYITSNRPGGVNGGNPGQFAEVWVSQRASLDDSWPPPANLGPVINSVGSNTASPNFSTDGHYMFFHSSRPGGCGGADLYVSHRMNKRDDFGWQTPLNLGCMINGPYADNAPTYFEDDETGIITMYLTSNRANPGAPGNDGYDIYASTLRDDGTFGPAVLVSELSSSLGDTRSAIRRDGLELFLSSNRAGGISPATGPGGANDLWMSTRATTLDRWSAPVNLGRPVNSEYEDGAPALSWDGTTMYFYSRRPGGFGGRDLYVTTRTKLR
jgi:hypothetical protein